MPQILSILPTISKILEKTVVRQMEIYINAKAILPKLQSGFRSNHSTCTAMLNLLSDLFDARDSGNYSTIVMLDYSQAFDSISHEMLVAKMQYYGFNKKVIALIESYLSERFQVTRLGSETSKPLIKSRGVPQGSRLGPPFFNLYTADLPSCVKKCTLHQYADDCHLHLSFKPSQIRSAVEDINSDLRNIFKWSEKNGLKLNINKCSVMHIAPKEAVQALSESGVRVSLNGQNLLVCDKAKTLGVVLDSDLTLSEHITFIIQRALGRLRGLYRFRDLLPEYSKIQLVQSIILSLFYYCYPAYSNSISRGDIERIQKLQNTAVRFVYCLKWHEHITPFRENANFPLMETVCRMLTGCMVHKTLTLREPEYLLERLRYREEVTQRGPAVLGVGFTFLELGSR